ncbi:uncharacterized protein [Cherax quadricarinatus]|uniref:uncharacterized protein isoform X1 n=1 Tax=Cherax quadricarinatus TaxID=27406 RepID=UPI00387E3619
MRPITSGIGSAPHSLAGVLEKYLSKLLGTISQAHLKHSGDLLNRIRDLDMSDNLASFDVTALFTNVPVDQAIDLLRRVINDDTELPVPCQEFVSLVELCVSYKCFRFEDKKYKQLFVLAMGSSLSAVLANLYMEDLESRRILSNIPSSVTWMRYVDDILVIVPKNLDVRGILNTINTLEPTIKFTLEEETDNQLPFLDVLLRTDENRLSFKVYRKPTYKNDLLHFFSHHNTRIKRRVVIGFFLRAYRISSLQFLEEECTYITNSFSSLHFPPHFIRDCRKRATRILNKTNTNQVEEKPPSYIVLPVSNVATNVSKKFDRKLAKISTSSSITIRNLIQKPKHDSGTNAGIYTTPYGVCDKVYVRETARSLDIRITEHKNARRNDDCKNARVQHTDDVGHLMKFNEAKLVIKEDDLRQRKCIEAALISVSNNIKQKSGSYSISKLLINRILPILETAVTWCQQVPL